MRDAVIVGAARTAVGKRNGQLSAVRPDDLAAGVLRELVTRVGIDATEVEDVMCIGFGQGIATIIERL